MTVLSMMNAQSLALPMKFTQIFIVGTMCLAAVVGITVRPSSKAADRGTPINLKSTIPSSFGVWRELPASNQIVNPQTQALLDSLYSQLLSRTYVNDKGYVIMLSMAYGDDQRGGLQAHRPEVCYPAQGFKLTGMQDAPVVTPHGPVDARRLNTSLGARVEPVTYWFTVADQTVRNKLEKRWVEIKLAMTGEIPDGLLFRVSSIDQDSGRAFRAHDDFVNQLLTSVPEADRMRLTGLKAKRNPS